MDSRSSSHISSKKPVSSPQGLQVSPSAPTPGFGAKAIAQPRGRRTFFSLLLAISMIVGGVAVGIFVEVWGGSHFLGYFNEVAPVKMQVCETYRDLKNAGNPAAEQLLTPLPTAPVDAISQEEAERYQADCFLRQDIRIQSIRVAPANRFVLVTKGNVSAPTLPIRTAKGVDRSQRTMVNPDLIVEVRDGIIHGVRAEMSSER